MICSVNEVENIFTKAAIGAGFHVGIAGEISNAGIWLSLNGFNGEETVLKVIQGKQRNSKVVFDDIGRPMFNDQHVGLIGPSVIDYLIASKCSQVIKLINIDVPLLMVGLAGVASNILDFRFLIKFQNNVEVNISKNHFSKTGTILAKRATITISIREGIDRHKEKKLNLKEGGIKVSDRAWGKLNKLAHLTYVKNSVASRYIGAGAGLIDND